MKIAFFDTHKFEKDIFLAQNQRHGHEISFFESRLTEQSANLALGFPCVCAFVNDRLNRTVLEILHKGGTRLIALRSAGFNHVDLKAAEEFKICVVRVPEYSPHAVAEHAVALLLSLNRKIHRAYNRVREGNFSLDGLVGFDLNGKKIGLIGTGKIGSVMAKIMTGFGCRVSAFDLIPNPELISLGVQYRDLDQILSDSDVLSLHIPLTPETHHLIDEKALLKTKRGIVIINTGRGGLIDTKALIRALKSGHLGGAGLDVYEEEEGIFFENFSDQILQDDQLVRLMTFPNVLLTSHQAFLTNEALGQIALTTLENVSLFDQKQTPKNEVHSSTHHKGK